MNLKRIVVCAVALVGFARGGTLLAAQPNHLDKLVHQLLPKTSYLHKEVHTHVSPAGALHRDVTEIQRLAEHLDELMHNGGNMAHIRADVRKLDGLVHHLDGHIDALARSGRFNATTIQHLRTAVGQVDRIVHHIADHVE